MAIKVYEGGAWVTVAEKNGVSETYTLPLTGATGGVGVGSARFTLDASAGTDTSITLNPGANINISSIDVNGDNRSFTIASTDTTYELPLLATQGGNGVGVATFTLTSSSGVTDPITIKAGTNISIGSINETNGEFTISASGGTQASPQGPTYAVQYNDNGSFGGTGNFTYDGLYEVAFLGVGGTMKWDGTQHALEFSDEAEASFGKSKDLQIYHSSGVSYIDEVIGNDLIIRGKASVPSWSSSNKIEINPESTRESIVAIANSSVQLYDASYNGGQHYHGKVLQTNTRGIGVFNTINGLGGELSIFESIGSGDNYISIACTTNLNASYTLTLPPDDGDAGEVLKTDGNGNLDWTTNGSGGGGTPGGSDSQIQYNNGGAFGGANYFTYTDSGTSAGDVTFIGTNANVYWNYSADSFTINNSAYLQVGTINSNDWATRIYSDNSGGAIWTAQQGGGSIAILGDDATTSHTITLKPNYSKDSIVATANAEVSLWYNGTKRIETTNDGIKITGGIQDKDGDLGTTGQVLSSTGSGTLDWITVSGGSGPTYTLPLTHTSTSSSSALTWTLTPTTGTSNACLLYTSPSPRDS